MLEEYVAPEICPGCCSKEKVLYCEKIDSLGRTYGEAFCNECGFRWMISKKKNEDKKALKVFRSEVLKRAKYKCQIPGCNETKNLEAHHMLPKKWFPQMMYNSKWGICVCEKHHNALHEGRLALWYPEKYSRYGTEPEGEDD